MKIELNMDEINMLLKYLEADICAGYGFIDNKSEDCETCKVTTLSTTIYKRLKAVKRKATKNG